MKREWGMVIDSKNGVVSAWHPESEQWIKGPNSEDDQAEYWLCVKAAKHIRDNPEKFIEVMSESEKKRSATR
jgi:hypothetical protein